MLATSVRVYGAASIVAAVSGIAAIVIAWWALRRHLSHFSFREGCRFTWKEDGTNTLRVEGSVYIASLAPSFFINRATCRLIIWRRFMLGRQSVWLTLKSLSPVWDRTNTFSYAFVGSHPYSARSERGAQLKVEIGLPDGSTGQINASIKDALAATAAKKAAEATVEAPPPV